MATITAARVRATVPGEIRYYPMASGQTWLKGAFVYINESTGYLTACAASPAGIAGIAEAAALDVLASYSSTNSATTSTLGLACPITIAKRGQQFTVQVTNNGSATVTTKTDIGKAYNIFVGTSTTNSNFLGFNYIDKNSGTRVLLIDDLADDDSEGDTNGRYICEVRGVYAQLDSGTS